MAKDGPIPTVFEVTTMSMSRYTAQGLIAELKEIEESPEITKIVPHELRARADYYKLDHHPLVSSVMRLAHDVLVSPDDYFYPGPVEKLQEAGYAVDIEPGNPWRWLEGTIHTKKGPIFF